MVQIGLTHLLHLLFFQMAIFVFMLKALEEFLKMVKAFITVLLQPITLIFAHPTYLTVAFQYLLVILVQVQHW
jgi:hypothetical protein